jgi:hypothetical protein
MRTADELADELAAAHVDYFRRNPKGEIIQTCMIEPEAGEPVFVQCGWRDEFERSITLEKLRLAMLALRAARYAIWTEVWTLLNPVPEGASMEKAEADFVAGYTHGDIAADPKRIEAVFTLVVEGKGRMVTRLQRIIRGRNGGVAKLVPLEGGDGLNLGGALADLMPTRTVN